MYYIILGIAIMIAGINALESDRLIQENEILRTEMTKCMMKQ
jgi:hypothetical protein